MRALPLLVLAAVLLAGCASNNNATTTTTTSTAATVSTTPASSPPASGDGSGTITIVTPKGTFAFQLLPQYAPLTSAHIKQLAASGFYDGIPFHRYVAEFVIQGGDPNCKQSLQPPCGSGGSGTTVPLETNPNAKHDYGAVGLARSSDPNSGDSQFYIVNTQAGDHSLDGSYTVFGKVTSGMDVVTQLRQGDLMTKVTVS